MKAFVCRVCDNPLYWENSVCVSCGTSLGYSREERAIVPVENGAYTDGDGVTRRICRNLNLSGCTWLTDRDDGFCFSCALTRTRPADDDVEGMSQYPVAEQAKRRLIYELDELGFPIVTREQDPEQGLTFDLLYSTEEKIFIGHDSGVITIDLAESDAAYRERMRIQLDEPYRTMLGHLRHEVGHYFEAQLVRGDLIGTARELFGDESESYADAIDRHYEEGPPADWQSSFISQYATMHPFEDFAETFAHYLHIWDAVDTANEFGLTTVHPEAFTSFRDLVTGVWMPLAIALNQINRSIGKDALYPFVIPAPVLDKLDFVASLRRR